MASPAPALRLAVHRLLRPVFYPAAAEGQEGGNVPGAKGVAIHPGIVGKDWQELAPGTPLFLSVPDGCDVQLFQPAEGDGGAVQLVFVQEVSSQERLRVQA